MNTRTSKYFLQEHLVNIQSNKRPEFQSKWSHSKFWAQIRTNWIVGCVSCFREEKKKKKTSPEKEITHVLNVEALRFWRQTYVEGLTAACDGNMFSPEDLLYGFILRRICVGGHALRFSDGCPNCTFPMHRRISICVFHSGSIYVGEVFFVFFNFELEAGVKLLSRFCGLVTRTPCDGGHVTELNAPWMWLFFGVGGGEEGCWLQLQWLSGPWMLLNSFQLAWLGTDIQTRGGKGLPLCLEIVNR